MKVFDLIAEGYHGFTGHMKDFGKVKRTIDQSIPNARIEPQLRNTDTYMQMRYGVALAAASATQGNVFDQDSPWGENLGMVAYSDEEIKIIQAADKLMGVKSVALSNKSKERDDIGSASPVADTSWRRS